MLFGCLHMFTHVCSYRHAYAGFKLHWQKHSCSKRRLSTSSELHPPPSHPQKTGSQLPSCPRTAPGHRVAELLSCGHGSYSHRRDLSVCLPTLFMYLEGSLAELFGFESSNLGKGDEYDCNFKVTYKDPFLQSQLLQTFVAVLPQHMTASISNCLKRSKGSSGLVNNLAHIGQVNLLSLNEISRATD